MQDAGQNPNADAELDDQFADVREEMKQRFALLPEQLQKVIMGSDYQQKLFDIAKANKLTYDELSTLEIDTTMVLIGMTRPEEYRDEIQVQLKKNDAEVDVIVKDVNDKVFGPVRSALERIYETQKEPEDFLQPVPVTSFAPAAYSAPVAPTAAAPIAPTPVVPPAAVPASAPTASAPISTPAAPRAMFTMPSATPVAAARPSPSAPAFDAAKSTLLSTAEKDTLAKTGVIITDTPVMPAAQQAPMVAPKPDLAMPNRGDVLRGIENPPKAAGISMDKLSSPLSATPATKTDYTLPKTTPQPPAAPASGDPYREPIA